MANGYGDGAGNAQHELISCVNQSFSGCKGSMHYKNNGGSSGSSGGGDGDGYYTYETIVHTETGSVGKTEVPSQRSPSIPNPPKGS